MSNRHLHLHLMPIFVGPGILRIKIVGCNAKDFATKYCHSRLVNRSTSSRSTADCFDEHCDVRHAQVNALVEATPISGPASVGMTTSLSRAIVEVGTLTMERTCCPCAPAYRQSRPTGK